jgi:hypothetical protein
VRDPERADQGRDRIDREGGQGADIEPARLQPGDGRHRRPAGFDVAQGLTGGAHQRLAGRGQDHAAPHPGEEGGPQLLLELLDRLGDRRLRDQLRFRGAGHPAVVDDREEQAQSAKIHR